VRHGGSVRAAAPRGERSRSGRERAGGGRAAGAVRARERGLRGTRAVKGREGSLRGRSARCAPARRGQRQALGEACGRRQAAARQEQAARGARTSTARRRGSGSGGGSGVCFGCGCSRVSSLSLHPIPQPPLSHTTLTSSKSQASHTHTKRSHLRNFVAPRSLNRLLRLSRPLASRRSRSTRGIDCPRSARCSPLAQPSKAALRVRLLHICEASASVLSSAACLRIRSRGLGALRRAPLGPRLHAAGLSLCAGRIRSISLSCDAGLRQGESACSSGVSTVPQQAAQRCVADAGTPDGGHG
jgi:hypothetical protein